MLHSICQQIWKIQQWPQDWKMSVFISIPNKGNAKECSNFCTIESTSHTSKVMLKILRSKLWQYVNWELPNIQPKFRKGRGTRDQIANIRWIIEKAREFQKNCFIDYAKAFDCVDQTWKFLKRWEYQTTLPASWETCMQVNKQHLEPHMEQWTGSKLGKEYVKAVYSHSVYFTSMQSTSYEILGWIIPQAGIKISRRNINSLRYVDDTTLKAKCEGELKSLLMKVKKESEKVGLKLSIQNTKIMASSPITSWQIEGRKVETVTDFIFLGSKITADGECSHEIKRRLLLGKKLW